MVIILHACGIRSGSASLEEDERQGTSWTDEGKM